MAVQLYSVDRIPLVSPHKKPRRNDSTRPKTPQFRSGPEQQQLLDRCCRQLGKLHNEFQRPLRYHDVEQDAWCDFTRRPAGRELLARWSDGDILIITNLSDVFFSLRDMAQVLRRLALHRALLGLSEFRSDDEPFGGAKGVISEAEVQDRVQFFDTGGPDFLLLAQLAADARKIDLGVRSHTASTGWLGRRTRLAEREPRVTSDPLGR